MMTKFGITLLSLIVFCLCSIKFALSAMTGSIWINYGIGFVKDMIVMAMRLSRSLCRSTITIPHIFTMSCHLKMRLTATRSYFTKMTQLHFFGNWFSKSEYMGIYKLRVASSCSLAGIEMSVAPRVHGTNPEPAIPEFWVKRGNRSISINMFPEALFHWYGVINTCHKPSPTSIIIPHWGSGRSQ